MDSFVDTIEEMLGAGIMSRTSYIGKLESSERTDGRTTGLRELDSIEKQRYGAVH